MIGHQSLMKLMLDPLTISLDGNLTGFKSACARRGIRLEEPVSEPYKFKTLYDQTERDLNDFQDKVLSLAEMLDTNTEQLVKAEELCVLTLCDWFRLKRPSPVAQKAPAKKKPAKKGKAASPEGPSEEEKKAALALVTAKEENRHIRDFLLSPFLSNLEDYNAFLMTLDLAKREFLDSVDDIKRCLGRTANDDDMF